MMIISCHVGMALLTLKARCNIEAAVTQWL